MKTQGLLPNPGQAVVDHNGEDICSVMVTSDLQPSGNAYTRENVCPAQTAWPCLGMEFQFGRVSKQ